METVLITGGSGIIGKRLSEMLAAQNYAVRHLSRSSSGNEKYPTYVWDLAKNQIDEAALKDVDYIIHLAGENVGGGRWSAERRKKIIGSRIDSANLLFEKLNGKPLKAFISSSGISYYGSVTTETIFKEDDPKGHDFLAEVSVKWEEAAFQFKPKANRVVALRTGVVLSPVGGALEKIKKPIKMGIGSALGSGKQYMPWLHLDDICGIYLKAVQDVEMEGIYNAVSSEHCTNQEFTQTIAKVLEKKLWAPKVPAFLLKLLFGEMAVIILEGSRISNEKIKQAGYTFKFNTLTEALNDLLKK